MGSEPVKVLRQCWNSSIVFRKKKMETPRRTRRHRKRLIPEEERSEDRSRSRERFPRSRSRHFEVDVERGESADKMSATDLSALFLNGIDKIIKRCGNSQSSNTGIQLNSTANIIAEFNPQRDNINKWIDSIDEYATIYGWNEITTIHFSLSKLRGPAETWYRSLETHSYAWKEWKSLLTATFPSKRDLHAMLVKMMNFKPADAPDIYTYCFSKLALINELH